jgi:hypothetical protein
MESKTTTDSRVMVEPRRGLFNQHVVSIYATDMQFSDSRYLSHSEDSGINLVLTRNQAETVQHQLAEFIAAYDADCAAELEANHPTDTVPDYAVGDVSQARSGHILCAACGSKVVLIAGSFMCMVSSCKYGIDGDK